MTKDNKPFPITTIPSALLREIFDFLLELAKGELEDWQGQVKAREIRDKILEEGLIRGSFREELKKIAEIVENE